MATPYLIIRLVPDAPVDGATFSTYLDDLHIDVYQANTTPPLTKLLGQTPWNAAPVILAPNPGTNQYVGTSSRPTTENTPYIGDQNYGNTLTFKNTDGIAVNSSLFSPSGSNFFSSKALTVKSVDGTTVTLDGGNIENFIPKGTVCAFMTDYTKWTYDSVAASMSNNHILVTKAKNGDSTLTLDGSGLFFGMAVSGPGIDADTTVLAADTGSVTLSKPITSDLVNTNITFSFSLPADIAQEFDLITTFSILGWPFKTAYIPASVATAIIPLPNLLSPPNMLNISINAYRKLGTGNRTIPVNHDFYNVPYYTDNPPVLSQFQYISDNEIALYITLPPPPSANVVPLALPNDGTPPNFDALYAAMTQTFASDNAFPLGSSLETLTSSDCKRMAYDIVWSQQGNTLPLPPDPLDSLYTNPPNPGGSGGNGNTNNLEQDRQKFEGTISSFYSTHNATAERLTKFVATASAALFCEKTSLNSKTALIEFPVDPDPTVTFATAVEKELLLNGVGGTSSGLSFGVPAAFFYAIGASLDKSATPAQRFQLATGDSIERLFQIFSAAEEANSISDKESFKTIGASAKTTLDCALGTNVLSFADTNGIQDNMSVAGLYIDNYTSVQSFTATTVTLSKPVLGDVAIGSIITFLSPAISVPTATAFQAARRLAALGISATSNSPSATIYPGTPLAQLISNWLAQTDPTPFPPPNPPLSYQHTDFNIWQLTLASADPQGYLYLDLDALTQGYSIPAFTLTPTGAPSPTTLPLMRLTRTARRLALVLV